MLLSLSDTYKLILEEDESIIKARIFEYDKPRPFTKILHRSFVKIIICDSFNNPFFPLPRPVLDGSGLDIPVIYYEFKNKYAGSDTRFLPWHYVIEFYDMRYIVFNTRPINIQFPLDSETAIKNYSLIDDEISFMEDTEIADCIHICIAGDSNKDIYTNEFYNVLKYFCINPIYSIFKVASSYPDFIYFLRTGKKLNKNRIRRD